MVHRPLLITCRHRQILVRHACVHVHFTLTRSLLCVIAKKRPRKPKGAPADDVALAKLRPSHSHSDVGGRDVITSTEATHVGSSGSEIGVYVHPQHLDF
jgi:hypothetical protein